MFKSTLSHWVSIDFLQFFWIYIAKAFINSEQLNWLFMTTLSVFRQCLLFSLITNKRARSLVLNVIDIFMKSQLQIVISFLNFWFTSDVVLIFVYIMKSFIKIKLWCRMLCINICLFHFSILFVLKKNCFSRNLCVAFSYDVSKF